MRNRLTHSVDKRFRYVKRNHPVVETNDVLQHNYTPFTEMLLAARSSVRYERFRYIPHTARSQ